MTVTRIDTDLIHAGEPQPRIGGAAVLPIFQSSVFENAGGGEYHDLTYPRLNNLPNHQVLGSKLAALEGAEDALVCASGMAAISTALLTVLRPGDHVLVQDCLYGGAKSLFDGELREFGIESAEIGTDADADTWARALRPNTRAVYVEALTNPGVLVIDHLAVTEFAREHGLTSLIDSTFASPVNFRPIEAGYDVVLHSATKYLNGHSDLAAGVVVGSRSLVERIRHRLNHLGGSLDAHACFLLHRGLKTLALRVRHQNQSALEIARFLERREGVSRVSYPGLESHPHHARAREMFRGAGGVLAFELDGGEAAAVRLLDQVELPIVGGSLGGVETLISMPSRLSHAAQSREERLAMGVTDGLIRYSVGIEAAEDLIADLGAALEAIR